MRRSWWCGDFHGHVGSDVGGFREDCGGFGIGQINDGGIRFLDWAVGKELDKYLFPEKEKLAYNI